jgi:membrane protease YdiL (CAAX protease family)
MVDPGKGPVGPKPHWLGTLLYVPVLYGVGWLISRPLLWLVPSLRPDQVDLIGAMLAPILLLISLPWRLRLGLGVGEPWRFLGLVGPPGRILSSWLRGTLKAAVLLLVVASGLLLAGVARWRGWAGLDSPEIVNALALAAGVGFAEELVFRGWLWGELGQLVGRRQALLYQAILFGLVHPWWRVTGLGGAGLLGGLILLGLVLGLQRRADAGALWGAMGLHGGLVGGWFALQAGPLALTASGPEWLLGPGGPGGANPIGGVIGWLALAGLILIRRPWWS